MTHSNKTSTIIKYYNFRGQTFTIYKRNGLWYDKWGCIYGLAEDENSFDRVSRCGVGYGSLPINHPANDACTPHDKKYSNHAYQLFHTRAEADSDLERDLSLIGYPVFGWFARRISRLAGWIFWEESKTR